MKIQHLVSSFVLTLAGLGVGYSLHPPVSNTASVMAVDQTPPFEYLLNPKSFSEIENTRAALDALGLQFLMELQGRRAGLLFGPTTAPRSLHDRAVLTEVVQELEQGRQAFQGTGQEVVLTQHLLWLLKKEKLNDRWLNTFLAFLYQHPTEPWVARWTDDAVDISRAAGREPEVLEALRHLESIPLQFDARTRAQAVLANRTPASPAAESASSRVL